jgi:hypothetical protein
VAGSADSAYTIELIPANGQAACSSTNATGTMIDSSTGMLTIRVTGRANTAGKGTYSYRSINASFRRDSFLDFLYFTNFETLDPEYLHPAPGNNDPSDLADYNWAVANCKQWVRSGRPSGCTGINFATGDTINGPAHTNDRFLITGSPTFGRTRADSIESSNDAPGWTANGSATPNFVGTLKAPAGQLSMPPTNDSLATVPGVQTYTGKTTITLRSDGKMDVFNKNQTPNQQNGVTPPASGVIYVKNGGCNTPYNGKDPYQTVADACPILSVGGVYTSNMTLASEGDIVVHPDQDTTGPAAGKGLRKSGDVMLGLIANNFVRVYHPVDSNPCNSTTNNSGGSTTNVQIDAAILSLTHSFWVDNYACGDRLGNLIVNGAIAQNFRGPVGTVGATGYTKVYTYDDRLRYRSPPYFLDPIESRWAVREFNEQLPANGP